MAHILNIPIAVELTLQKDRWVLATAEVRGWSRDFEDPLPLAMAKSARKHLGFGSALRSDELVFAVSSQKRGEKPSSIHNENLYRIANSELAKEIATIYAPNARVLDETGLQFPILWAPDRPKGWHRDRDPWQMREEFLRLKKDDSALLDFANKWGGWDFENLYLVSDGAIPQNIKDYHFTQFIMPDRVWKMQDSYRTALRVPAEDWLSKFAALRGLEKRSTFPYLVARSHSCREAIETTITIDLLKKVRFRVCARSDCDNVFSLDSRHKRKYCQQYCGHLESVRKQRLATQRAKSKKSQGA